MCCCIADVSTFHKCISFIFSHLWMISFIHSLVTQSWAPNSAKFNGGGGGGVGEVAEITKIDPTTWVYL